MDSLPNVTSNLSLGRILEAFKDQQTFLNFCPSENPLLYWIFLIFKCILAGCGTKYLRHTKMTVAFLCGVLINACVNRKSLFFIVYSVIFLAANAIGLNYLNTDAHFPVILWLLFRVYDESEFYMDIYLVFCFLVLIFRIYDKEYLKAITFINITAGFSWMVEKGTLYTTGNPYVCFLIQLCLLIVLKPSINYHLENDSMRERCYYYVCLAVIPLLMFSYSRMRVIKGYYQELTYAFRECMKDFLFLVRLLINITYEMYNKFNIIKLILLMYNKVNTLNPVSAVEEAIINTNSTSPSLPSMNM